MTDYFALLDQPRLPWLDPEKLKARKETVGVSESSAGGLISAVLLAVPGASAYFMGGAVVYTRPAGEAFLTATPSRRKGIRSSS